MWVDERGSEVLDLAECRRLLALGAKDGRHGHLGLAGEGAPVILPVDYAMEGPDILIRIGDGLLEDIESHPEVAFQVDGLEHGRTWSVLVRGYAARIDAVAPGAGPPVPRIARPGRHLMHIRSDATTGRRITEKGTAT